MRKISKLFLGKAKLRLSKHSITRNIILTIGMVVFIFFVTIVIIMMISGDMSKYSTLINDTGRIRGGIQRVVKMEIDNKGNDTLILKIDLLINKAIATEKSRFFKFSEFKDYSSLLSLLYIRWHYLKQEIKQFREKSIHSDILINDSESIWILSDEVVSTIEKTSHYDVILYYIFSIIGGFGVIILIVALVATKVYVRDHIEYNAEHDQLTGIFNRHYFYEFFEREWLLANRKHRNFAILMCDIDFFKLINDKYGHDAGDEVLKTVAKKIQVTSRETDLIARFGGEEFIILTMDDDINNAVSYAERIRKAIEELVLLNNTKITMSIGVSEYKNGLSSAGIIKQADKALYKAKRNGRNQVVMN